ncbi:MAG: choice-of-anchor R domain-containing protein [Rhizomicrobium sp.]
MSKNRTFQNGLLATALTLAASTALAGDGAPVTVRMNGAVLLAGPAVGPLTKAPTHRPGPIEIFDNMFPVKKYPYGTYFCCLGPTIAGPDNSYGTPAESWAEAFTPVVDATVTRVEVGVGYSVGTNSVNIGLNSDAGGVPGTALVSRDVKNLPPFGSCCATMTLRSGVQVTAGTKYWVVLGTDAGDADLLGGWNYDTMDQVTDIDQAENIGNGWRAGAIAPGVALAVWGK